MTWVYTYTDCAGNTHNWNFIYTIDIPDFTMPLDGDTTVNCLADAQVPPTPPAVNDFCGNPISPTLNTTPTEIPCEGTMTWVYTYTDCAGNTHNWNFIYTLDIPDFTMPLDEDTTVNCLADAQVPPTPPAVNDFCGNPISPTLNTTPTEIPCEGTMTWVYTYTDCAGNTHNWNFIYTLDIPDFTMPLDGDTTVNCLADAQVPPTPPAVNDFCGNPISPTLNTTPTEIPCEGTMTWVYTYTDCAGNTHNWNFIYTLDIPDFTMPLDGDTTVNCLADAQVPPTPPAVNDFCGNPISPTLNTTPTEIPCEGTMTWVYTYTDCAGNTHNWNFIYTIDIPDFTMPLDGDTTVNCLADAQVPPTPPAVNDFCGNPISPTLNTTPTEIPCEGTMTWVYTYTDCAGNTHNWNFIYTIDIPDFTMPLDGDTTVNCLADAQVPPTPPAVNDFCGNPISPTLNTTPTEIPCEGTMTWVYTYTDCAGNTHNWNFTYTIDIPDFTMPLDGDTTVNCLADAQVPPTPPAVNDFCGNPISPTLNTTPTEIPCEGTMTWVYTYTDCAGNHP